VPWAEPDEKADICQASLCQVEGTYRLPLRQPSSQIAFQHRQYSSEREDIAAFHLESSVMVRFVIRDTFELEPDWQPVGTISAS
jgi:hypothetical protein